jgi:hypothetical protein
MNEHGPIFCRNLFHYDIKEADALSLVAALTHQRRLPRNVERGLTFWRIGFHFRYPQNRVTVMLVVMVRAKQKHPTLNLSLTKKK